MDFENQESIFMPTPDEEGPSASLFQTSTTEESIFSISNEQNQENQFVKEEPAVETECVGIFSDGEPERRRRGRPKGSKNSKESTGIDESNIITNQSGEDAKTRAQSKLLHRPVHPKTFWEKFEMKMKYRSTSKRRSKSRKRSVERRNDDERRYDRFNNRDNSNDRSNGSNNHPTRVFQGSYDGSKGYRDSSSEYQDSYDRSNSYRDSSSEYQDSYDRSNSYRDSSAEQNENSFYARWLRDRSVSRDRNDYF